MIRVEDGLYFWHTSSGLNCEGMMVVGSSLLLLLVVVVEFIEAILLYSSKSSFSAFIKGEIMEIGVVFVAVFFVGVISVVAALFLRVDISLMLPFLQQQEQFNACLPVSLVNLLTMENALFGERMLLVII